MNKWNCEVRKRINRKEFRDFMTDINSKSKCDLYKRVNSRKKDKNNTSGLNGERGIHRGSLLSRNCNSCNIDVSNNDNNNNNNDDDDDDDDNNDDNNLTCTNDTCHFLISSEKFLFDILKLGSFQEKWESLDEKRRCVLLFRCMYNCLE
eukprot:Pgem_evm1s2614